MQGALGSALVRNLGTRGRGWQEGPLPCPTARPHTPAPAPWGHTAPARQEEGKLGEEEEEEEEEQGHGGGSAPPGPPRPGCGVPGGGCGVWG